MNLMFKNDEAGAMLPLTREVGEIAEDVHLNASPRDDKGIKALPARLRPVLRRLLAGDSEKQVALKLGLSPHTVHEYTKALYRAFDVNSRAELLAQFVIQDN